MCVLPTLLQWNPVLWQFCFLLSAWSVMCAGSTEVLQPQHSMSSSWQHSAM
jgi:hypothetical protein